MHPLQFGLGVEVLTAMGSKWLNNELSRLGFALSYEVLRYKLSVLFDKDINPQQEAFDGYIQYATDNVDHNVCTQVGMGTFHRMGIISWWATSYC